MDGWCWLESGFWWLVVELEVGKFGKFKNPWCSSILTTFFMCFVSATPKVPEESWDTSRAVAVVDLGRFTLNNRVPPIMKVMNSLVYLIISFSPKIINSKNYCGKKKTLKKIEHSKPNRWRKWSIASLTVDYLYSKNDSWYVTTCVLDMDGAVMTEAGYCVYVIFMVISCCDCCVTFGEATEHSHFLIKLSSTAAQLFHHQYWYSSLDFLQRLSGTLVKMVFIHFVNYFLLMKEA